MKSKYYRTQNLFLRNEFEPCGEWGLPLVRKQALDLSVPIDLISYSDTSKHDDSNLHKGVHFFIDDYRFEPIYRNPERSYEKLSRYRFLLTPDHSLYSEMPPWRQIESIGMSRWVGAYWQSKGQTVVPTISWAQPSSYRFCFDGVEKHSIVAVGMIGCKHERIAFMRGYNAMLESIEPSAIICFGKAFPEMEGNIIQVDYMSTRKVVRHGR
ncbi:MAG: DUF4417 domain-containing protein [Mogibacterium sp.]|nr:DUF4417 domain-containing protein [Mogibacterium sp.]